MITIGSSTDWLTPLATVTAALLGAGAVLWQIGRQGRLNRESVEENERRRLKSRMYEDVELACRQFYEAQAAYIGGLMSAMMELQYVARSHQRGSQYAPPSARVMRLSNLRVSLQAAHAEIVSLIEQRQYVASGILVFRSALASAMFVGNNAFSDEFFDRAMRMLPTDVPDGSGIYPYTPPSVEDAEALYQVSLKILNSVQVAVSYVTDFAAEMQNLLVADLFGTVVQHRVPFDPTSKVITLEKADELERYFLEKTEWGEMIQSEEAKALARFSPPQSAPSSPPATNR